MSDVTNYDGRLEAMAYYAKTMYENIAKVENAYHDSEETVYSKTLPSKYLDWFGIKKIGGNTVIMNQINDNGASSSTGALGTVFTNNGDGSWTLSGTASGDSGYDAKTICTPFETVAGHKYLLRAYVSAGSLSDNTFIMALYGGGGYTSIVNNAKIFTETVTRADSYLQIRNVHGTSPNVTVYPQLIDLTRMFGAGNEPSTVQEAEAILAAPYYAYNAGSLLSAGVTSVISKDSNNETLETFSIPEDITTVEGYGLSCPGAYNYIDFETKQYVQAVASRDYEAGDESDSTVITDGTTTNYQLDEPLAFDVELPDEIITKVEAGGTLTFENQHEGDYNIPVPVQLEYIGA